MPALVKDSQGGIVYGLAGKDFVIEDDGVEQSVRLDEAPEGQPVSPVLAIQRGGRASVSSPHARLEVNARSALRFGRSPSAVVKAIGESNPLV